MLERFPIVLAICLGLALCGLGFALARWLSNRRIEALAAPLCHDDLEALPEREVGLVLGCTRSLKSGRPNRYFVHRIAAAVPLFRAGKVARLIVSGASHRGEVDEAQSMEEALVEQGVPRDRIVRDAHGYRTIDSVLRASQVFGAHAYIVISQRFHVERALYLARHRGIDASGFAAKDVAQGGSRLVRFREVFARIRALVDVHLLRTRPRTLERESPRADARPVGDSRRDYS